MAVEIAPDKTIRIVPVSSASASIDLPGKGQIVL